jgi:threonine aldolase
MRAAMAAAEVGDDALGDDPTTRKLEEIVAQLLGKERALFFPSGVMANTTGLALLGRPGGEILVEAGAHVLNYEEGAAPALFGVMFKSIPTPDGMLSAERIRPFLHDQSLHLPRTCAIEVENTHLLSGGRVMPTEALAGIAALARERGLRVHLDGARLWNACAASGHSPADYARHADTVMVALSKALGCPVGSMLAGDAALMDEAWRIRRRLGGAMRQSGILAAAGLYALARQVEDIRADHERARRLAAEIGRIPGFRVVEPETNVVLIDVESDAQVVELLSFLRLNRILILKFGTCRLRAVTHRDVDDAGIDRAVAAFRQWTSGERGN